MPITRRQTREHSRHLRSRDIPLEQSHGERKKSARRLPLQRHTIHMNGRTECKELRAVQNNRESDHGSSSLLIGCEEAAGCGKPTKSQGKGGEVSADGSNEEEDPSLQNGLTSSPLLSPRQDSIHSGTLEDDPLAYGTPHDASSQPQNLEDIGVGKDDNWDPLPGQHQEPPPLIKIDDRDEYEVDDILEARLLGKGQRLQFKVKWKGYPMDNVWYYADGGEFDNSQAIVDDFYSRFPNAPRSSGRAR